MDHFFPTASERHYYHQQQPHHQPTAFTRSSSFDTAAPRNGYRSSSLARPLPAGPGVDSLDRPLLLGTAYRAGHGAQMNSQLGLGLGLGLGAALGRRLNSHDSAGRPPLPPLNDRTSVGYSTTRPYFGSYSSTSYASRPARSVSVDRSALYQQQQQNPTAAYNAGQVHNITSRFERLIGTERERSGSYGSSALSQRRGSGSGSASQDQRLLYAYDRRDSLGAESDESGGESKDALGALPLSGPGSGPYRVYRAYEVSPAAAAAAAASSTSNGDLVGGRRSRDSPELGRFSRGDALRSSVSSTESSASRSSGRSSSNESSRRMSAPPKRSDEDIGRAGLLGLQNLGNTVSDPDRLLIRLRGAFRKFRNEK